MMWAGIFITCIGLVIFLSSFDTPVFDKQPEEEPGQSDPIVWDTRARMLHKPPHPPPEAPGPRRPLTRDMYVKPRHAPPPPPLPDVPRIPTKKTRW